MSRQNPRVKELCALNEKKHRKATGRFRLDGKKLFLEAVASNAEIVEVWLSEGASDAVREAVLREVHEGRLNEKMLIFASESVFEKLSAEVSPEGVITVVRALDRLHRTLSDGERIDKDGFGAEKLLIAESLRDAGNLGTVLRSCAALGIDRLILSDDCAELYNPKTLRAAMGAIFRIPTLTVKREALPQVIAELRASGRHVYAAALREGALPIGEFAPGARDCFVIGNEGHGLSSTLIEACDAAAIIPMREGNESLNAAAAATVCIWETVRAK